MYQMALAGLEAWNGSADGRFFTLEQRARMKGRHLRRRGPAPGRTCVAGVALPELRGPRVLGLESEPVTITIGEVEPWGGVLHVVEHLRWAGEPDTGLVGRLRETLWGHWRCRKVVISGVAPGQRLLSALPPEPSTSVVQLVGEARPRPDLGRALLAAIERGRIAMYADDGSPEHREFWAQAVRARVRRTEGGSMDFYVEPSTGDGGFLMSLALAGEAARLAAEAAEPVAA